MAEEEGGGEAAAAAAAADAREGAGQGAREGGKGDSGSAFSRCLEQLCEVREELRRLHEGEVAALQQDKLSLQEKLELGSHRLKEVQAQLKEYRKQVKVPDPPLDESTQTATDLGNDVDAGNCAGSAACTGSRGISSDCSPGNCTGSAACTGSTGISVDGGAGDTTPLSGGGHVAAVLSSASAAVATVGSGGSSASVASRDSAKSDAESPGASPQAGGGGDSSKLSGRRLRAKMALPEFAEAQEKGSCAADSEGGLTRALSKQTVCSEEKPATEKSADSPATRGSTGTTPRLAEDLHRHLGHVPSNSSLPGMPTGSNSGPGFRSILPSAIQEAHDSAGMRCNEGRGSVGIDLGSTASRCSSKESNPGQFAGMEGNAIFESPHAHDVMEGEQRFQVLDSWTHDEVIMQSITQSWECIPAVGGSGVRRCGRRTSSHSLVESILPFEDGLRSYILHPTSKKRVVWDGLAAIFTATDVCFVPLYFFDMPTFFFTIVGGWVSRIFWALDVFATFLTGIYIRGMLELRPHKIARAYLRSWFMPDLLILSTQWLALCFEESQSPGFWPVMAFLRGARVLRLLRLLRLLKVQMVLHEIGSKFSSHATLTMVSLFKFILFSAIAAHFTACIWYGIGWSREDGWVYRHQMENANVLRSYVTSLHWTIAQLHGSGSFQPGNSQEYIFANTVNCGGLIILCYLVGAITNMMMQMDLMRSKDIRQQRLLCGYLKRHRISSTLAVRARIHFETVCKQKQEDQLEEDQTKAVLAVLPQSLQLDIAEEMRAPIMSNYSFLSDVHEDNPRIVRHLCHEALSEVSAQNGEVIFTAGDVCRRMLFIMSGASGYTLLRRPSSPRLKSRHGMTTSFSSVLPMPVGFGVRAISEVERSPTQEFECWSHSDEPSKRRNRSRSPSDGNISDIPLNPGDFVSEAVLWTTWEYCGELSAHAPTTMLALDASCFAAVISRNISAYSYAVRYARVFVKRLNQLDECSDVLRFHLVKSAVETEPFELRQPSSPDELARSANCKSMASLKRSIRRLEPLLSADATTHYIFISHHKAEAGTEAALMQEALERMIMEDQHCCGHSMKAPVFLDSEDLSDLSQLKEHVRKSRNLVVLLTKEVLERPWVLVEIATATNAGMNIVPVEVQKKDMSFDYPDEGYFQKLLEGKTVTEDAMRLLLLEGISLVDLEKTLRKVFKKIAVPFSPHKSANVRDAELRDILRRCQDSVELS